MIPDPSRTKDNFDFACHCFRFFVALAHLPVFFCPCTHLVCSLLNRTFSAERKWDYPHDREGGGLVFCPINFWRNDLISRAI